MTTPKKRGTGFEYRVAYLFEGLGYSWDRSGSSLGIDLKISKKGRLKYLINCKKTSTKKAIYLPKPDVEKLKESSRLTGAKGLVCFGFNRTPILAVPLEKISKLSESRLYYKLTEDSGTPLKSLVEKTS